MHHPFSIIDIACVKLRTKVKQNGQIAVLEGIKHNDEIHWERFFQIGDNHKRLSNREFDQTKVSNGQLIGNMYYT